MELDADSIDRAELLAELADLRERASRLEPIPVPFVDNQQCLRDALAACLRLPPGRVPERRHHEDLDAWDARVAEQLGVRLVTIHADEQPPSEPWIAIVDGGFGDERTHAVACLGNDHAARGRLAGFRIVPA
jgi:hypothetical protein